MFLHLFKCPNMDTYMVVELDTECNRAFIFTLRPLYSWYKEPLVSISDWTQNLSEHYGEGKMFACFPPRQLTVPTELSRLLPLIWIIIYYIICVHIYVHLELETTFLLHFLSSAAKSIYWKKCLTSKKTRDLFLSVDVVREGETNTSFFLCHLSNIEFTTVYRQPLLFNCKRGQGRKYSSWTTTTELTSRHPHYSPTLCIHG